MIPVFAIVTGLAPFVLLLGVVYLTVRLATRDRRPSGGPRSERAADSQAPGPTIHRLD